MKCKCFFIALLIMLLQLSGTAHACTSFAVYSNQVFYGMNFDFMTLPIKFLISVNGDIRTFHLAFERTIGDVKFFVNTAGMNSKGLFSSCQELQPENDNPPEKTDNNIFTFELYEAIAASRSAEEIKRRGQKLPVIDMPGITLHTLFADKYGSAFTAEAGDPDTVFTEKKGDFIVMTNFSTNTMVGKNYRDARGTGADRYILSHEFLQQHAFDFSVDTGFELLSMCCNKDPQYPTQCSMVFDPQKGEVYIALERNFFKILRVSLKTAAVEPYKGYERKEAVRIPEGVTGILAKDLKLQFN